MRRVRKGDGVGEGVDAISIRESTGDRTLAGHVASATRPMRERSRGLLEPVRRNGVMGDAARARPPRLRRRSGCDGRTERSRSDRTAPDRSEAIRRRSVILASVCCAIQRPSQHMSPGSRDYFRGTASDLKLLFGDDESKCRTESSRPLISDDEPSGRADPVGRRIRPSPPVFAGRPLPLSIPCRSTSCGIPFAGSQPGRRPWRVARTTSRGPYPIASSWPHRHRKSR